MARVATSVLDGLQPPHGNRSAGIHVSDLLRRIAARAGLLAGEDFTESTRKKEVNLRMHLGLAWEDYLASRLKSAMPSMLYHPGEFYMDGIWGSPDGWDPDSDRILEFKLTWKSSKRPIEREWLWLAQAKAYCHMCGCTRAVLVVMHVNGDYSGWGPVLLMHDIEFSEQELRDNWRLLVESKELLEVEVDCDEVRGGFDASRPAVGQAVPSEENTLQTDVG